MPSPSIPNPGQNPTPAHVRGAATYRMRATFGLLVGATVVDGALLIALFFLLHRAFRLPPVPEPWWVAAVIFLFGAGWSAQRLGLGRTLGDRVWRLQAEQPGLLEPRLRPTRLEARERLTGIFLTTLSVLACAWSIDLAVFKQPIWATARLRELDAYLPDMASGRWEVLPFFYTLGAWPRNYGGNPVFYSLPYEKGPPTVFIGHLTARWEAPGTRVTFEGPKTPQAPVTTAGERTPRERIRECLLGESHSWSCLKIREATLLRHLNDIQRRLTGGQAGGNVALKMRWEVSWFEVRNPALRPADQAQGIYLSAEDEGHGEERYVLITENGTHQAIFLDYPDPASPGARKARETFEQSVRSLRASDDLVPGREWIDRKLADTDLTRELTGTYARPSADPQSIADLADAQSLLLAKISVQPGVFDPYYLLGATASTLNRIARAAGTAGSMEGLELAAVSKPLIQAAYRYAQDLAPQDHRTTQLQGFLLESQKP